jgi:hypothetical protein
MQAVILRLRLSRFCSQMELMRPEDSLRLLQSSLIDENAFSELKRRLASDGKMKVVTPTRSMVPCIYPGDAVEIEPIEGDLKRFDIIVYWDGKNLVCHIYWHENSLAWGGPRLFVARALDPKLGEDLPALPSALLGKVISHRLSPWQKWKLIKSAWLAKPKD